MEPMPPADPSSVYSTPSGAPQSGAAAPPPDSGKVTGLRVAKVLTWLVYAYVVVAVVLLALDF
ncbi:MAG TPA: hypothetical protein PKA98_22310, partial [Acidimicrobiales bacterium]|nr:hypothetical protein [Acidimicrobiales bacterium]